MNKGNEPDQQDRTILKPKPGGSQRPGGNQRQAAPTPANVATSQNDNYTGQAVYAFTDKISSKSNNLVRYSANLFALVVSLRNTTSHQNFQALKQQLSENIREFSSAALQSGYSVAVIEDASYALCTLLDETVLNTPWGSHSTWGEQTLLSIFHGETWGGENFFSRLNSLKGQPGENLDVLELFYICLSLGLQGRYRVLNHGASQLDMIKKDLYETIRRLRGDYEQSLSIHWKGVDNLKNALRHYLPWWVALAVCALLLLIAYLIFIYLLNGTAASIFGRLDAVAREKNPLTTEFISTAEYFPVIEENTIIEERKLSLQELLAPEIEQGLVDVFDQDDSVVVRTRGLFASGSSEILPDMLSLIDRIGTELSDMQGRVVVEGHTDNDPIFTVRFPSNWHLSEARAEAVKQMLETKIIQDVRVEAEGRAANSPVVENDSKEHKALNRRVEVIVYER